MNDLLNIAERFMYEDKALGLALLHIVHALKQQPGFDTKKFDDELLAVAKDAEKTDDKKLAFYLTIAAGRRPSEALMV